MEATIESLTLEGQGCPCGWQDCLHRRALPGEQVTFRYTSHKAKHDEGKVETVLSASPERVEPKCQHFGVCGACSWQHIALDAQIRHKQQALLDQLERIGKVEPETVFEPLTLRVGLTAASPSGCTLGTQKEKALVSFREKDGGFLAELNRCEILHPSIGEHLTDFQDLVSSLMHVIHPANRSSRW